MTSTTLPSLQISRCIRGENRAAPPAAGKGKGGGSGDRFPRGNAHDDYSNTIVCCASRLRIRKVRRAVLPTLVVFALAPPARLPESRTNVLAHSICKEYRNETMSWLICGRLRIENA